MQSSVVDDTRLELVTSRTSSGCATSCANRPSPYQRGLFYRMVCDLSSVFRKKIGRSAAGAKNLLDFAVGGNYNSQADK